MPELSTLVNVAFVVLFAPLLDGIERRVKARLQTRQGPPILQSWYDLIKLLKRPSIEPSGSFGWLFRLAPAVALSSVLLASTFVPSLLARSMGFWGDLIAFVYLLALASLFLALGGFASCNPYAQIGSHREISLLMAEEFSLAFIVAGLAVSAGGLAFSAMFPLPLKASSVVGVLAFAVMVYVSGARVPFDVAEAEPEIVEGPLIEFSGRSLGLMKLTAYVRRLLLFTVLLNFVIPFGGVLRSSVYVAALLVLSAAYAAFEAYFGRFRTADAVRFLKRFAAAGFVCWLLAVLGW